MKRYVLDSSALVDFLRNADLAEEVEQVLWAAVTGNAVVLIPTSAWSEVCSAVWRDVSQTLAEDIIRRLEQLPVEFVDIDHATASAAAEISSRLNVPLTCAISAAVAQIRKAALVTSGKLDSTAYAHAIRHRR